MDAKGTAYLQCPKCKGKEIRLRWDWKDEEEKAQMLLCHDGWGFQAEDATIECVKCGKKWK